MRNSLKTGKWQMRTVLAAGVFDILHPGHLYFLRQAKALGKKLVVVITSDATALKQGKKTVFTEVERQALVQSLAFVDKVLIGARGQVFASVLDIKPDVVALGYDQWQNISGLKKQLEKLGWRGQVIRIKKYGNYASSKVKK